MTDASVAQGFSWDLGAWGLGGFRVWDVGLGVLDVQGLGLRVYRPEVSGERLEWSEVDLIRDADSAI